MGSVRRAVVLAGAVLSFVPASAAAAMYTVTNTNDSGPGSLRNAVSHVNAGSGGDTIVIPASTTPYVLTSGELVVTKPVTITGGGAASTTVSGGNNSRIFDFASAGPNAVSDLTLTRGSSGTSGGAIVAAPGTLKLSSIVAAGNTTTGFGGAVEFAAGTLMIAGSSFSNDTAMGFGGGAVQAGGNGSSHDTVVISSSSFTGNSAKGSSSFGGALEAGGGGSSSDKLTITASTFANNSATSFGGAISASGGGGNTDTATITNTTIAGNTLSSASAFGGGAFVGSATAALRSDTIDGNTASGSSSSGGGVSASTATRVVNTIVANNTGGNCGSPLTSQGHNIESTNTCGFTAATDHVNTDPLLGPLQDNGGPTPTQALGAGSPAVDQGGNSVCPATDQRGVARPQGPACDIGAYETAPPAATTGTATGVGASSATLGGSAANPDAVPATVFLQYGTSTAYGKQTAARSLAAMSGSTGFSATVTALAPRTEYHFRAVAVNPDGTRFGADETFTTTAATISAATLSGLRVSPRRFSLTGRKINGRCVKPTRNSNGNPHCRRPIKVRVSYKLNGAVNVTFTIKRKVSGRRVNGRCVKATSTNQGRKPCVRLVKLPGQLIRAGRLGANRFIWNGKVGRHELAPGTYQLIATPAGGKPREVTFKIVP